VENVNVTKKWKKASKEPEFATFLAKFESNCFHYGHNRPDLFCSEMASTNTVGWGELSE
jgi:hypothetical protein